VLKKEKALRGKGRQELVLLYSKPFSTISRAMNAAPKGHIALVWGVVEKGAPQPRYEQTRNRKKPKEGKSSLSGAGKSHFYACEAGSSKGLAIEERESPSLYTRPLRRQRPAKIQEGAWCA